MLPCFLPFLKYITCVGWVKVRGHSMTNPADMTVVGNNRADKAADRGQEGKTCGEIEIATYMRRELGR